MRRRGSTLAELLFTLALCVTVVTTATLLYSTITGGTLDAAAMLDTSDGDDRLAQQIDLLINNAISAEVKTLGGRTVLKLTMSAERGERDANGFYTEYNPSYLHPRLADVYLPGERVWIYSGSPTAAIGASLSATSAGVPLLARRSDDATPALADVDWLWTYRDGDGKAIRRHPANTTLAFSISGSLVSWSASAVRADGSTLASMDANNAITFRELKLESSALLRQAAPQ
ncbi:hypothetical protein EON77_02730 [bacterium]|nr:MAG: hypothetical protein EON77_02730 [bacterium]